MGLKAVKTMLKGLWVGSTMTVPGVSGGTMAVVIGIYEELIEAVNGFLKHPGKYALFLLQFVLAGAAGFLFFARFITYLLQNGESAEVVRFFFCGVVLGGVPLLVEKSQVKKLRFREILAISCGALVVLLLARLPQGLFAGGNGFPGILLQAAGGLLIAVALILPGISATHMLYILGIYEQVLEQVYQLKILELLPFAVGGILGTILTAGAMAKLLETKTGLVYLAILGFVMGSLETLIPTGKLQHPFAGIAALVAGFAFLYLLSRRTGER